MDQRDDACRPLIAGGLQFAELRLCLRLDNHRSRSENDAGRPAVLVPGGTTEGKSRLDLIEHRVTLTIAQVTQLCNQYPASAIGVEC